MIKLQVIHKDTYTKLGREGEFSNLAKKIALLPNQSKTATSFNFLIIYKSILANQIKYKNIIFKNQQFNTPQNKHINSRMITLVHDMLIHQQHQVIVHKIKNLFNHGLPVQEKEYKQFYKKYYITVVKQIKILLSQIWSFQS